MTTAAYTLFDKEKNWRNAYYWLEGIFYFFQGFYMTGMTTYISVSLANWKVPIAAQAAVMAAIGIPTYLKMFTGLLSDRVTIGKWGRRKPYLFLGAVLYVPAFIAVTMINEFSSLWTACVIAAYAAWVLVDGTLDAMTVDVTPEERAGTMQGVANGARYGGMALGFLIVPTLGPTIGWTPVVLIIGVSALAQTVAALFFKEVPITRQEIAAKLPLKKVAKEAFGKPRIWAGMAFCLLFMGSMAGIGQMISPLLLTTMGWNKSPQLIQLYGFTNLVSYIAMVGGSILFRKQIRKHRHNFKFFAIATVASWVLMASWLLVYWSPENTTLVFVAQFCSGIARGLVSVLTYAVVMMLCPESIEGFMFATLTSLMNVGQASLVPNTITAAAPALGGVIPGFFAVLPYSFLGLFFLYIVLRSFEKEKAAAAAAPAPAEAEPA